MGRRDKNMNSVDEKVCEEAVRDLTKPYPICMRIDNSGMLNGYSVLTDHVTPIWTCADGLDEQTYYNNSM
jgi:hypothetical protein